MDSATTTNSVNLISCGKFGKTVGLKGAIRFIPSSGQVETIVKLKHLFLSPSHKLQIVDYQLRHEFVILTFSDFENVDNVSSLVNKQAFLDQSELPLLSDEYYWFQLIGLEVIHNNKKSLGVVEKLYTNGPQDILCTSDGFQVPYVKPDIVQDVSLDSKRIFVDFEPFYVDN